MPSFEWNQQRVRDALGPFVDAALRSPGREALRTLPAEEAVRLDVPAWAVWQALNLFEEELAHRAVSNRWIEQVEDGAVYRLEIAGDGESPPTVFFCRDLDEVRELITASAQGSVGAVESALGFEPGAKPAGDLAAMLGRQAFRRLVGDLREWPGTEATFDLPDRPWLRLADPVALAGATAE